MSDPRATLDVDDTRDPYGTADLASLIAPTSVAVVGASNKPTFGLQVLRAIRGGSFDGDLYAVHPRETDVDGVPTFPSVAGLPGAVDLAIIGVQASLVPGVLEECADRGVRSALIHAAGFAETGTPEGSRLHREVERIRAVSGMKIAGPNCLGLWNFRRNLSLARRLHVVDKAGAIGIASQSGGLGSFLFDVPGAESLFSYCLCSGNSLDIDVFDLVNFLIEDDQTRAIAMVVEGISNGRRLQQVGARARAAGKPIIAFKCGRTERGARAALSHTASIAGGREVVDAAFARAGVITVDGYDDLVETAVYFSRVRPRTGTGGVGVATTTGGFAVMACDAAEEAGVALPPPSASTLAGLESMIPGFGTVGNPADLAGGPGGAKRFAGALRAFAADPAFDTVVVPLGPSMDGAKDRVLDAALVAAASEAHLSIYWVNPWESGPALEAILADRCLSMFRSLQRMFGAIRKWQWWSGLEVAPPHEDGVPGKLVADIETAVNEVLDGLDGEASIQPLTEVESRRICAAAGIDVVAAEHVYDTDSASDAAGRLGPRTVVKVVSRDLPHKSDVGGVKVGVEGQEAAAAAFEEVVANAGRHSTEARLDGALVSPMLAGVAEVLVGARRDPVFGPAIVINWGGTAVELNAAPVVRLTPVDLPSAREMIGELPGYRRLTGYRGSPAGDLESLAQAITQLSALIVSDRRIVEVELNPVLVREAGAGVAALDALVVLDPSGSDK